MYTNQERLKNHLQRELTAYEAGNFKIALAAAERIINHETGRTFGDGTGIKYFDGNKDIILDTPPFAGDIVLQFLDSDGAVSTTIDAADYSLYPANNINKNYIRLETTKFPLGIQNIKIEADWGTVPDDICMAATILVAQGLADPGDNLKKETIEGYSYELMDNTSKQNDTLLAIWSTYERVML